MGAPGSDGNLTRRDFLRRSTSAVVTAAWPGVAGNTKRDEQTQPNVIFVFVDQLRASVCGVYGGDNIETPNIDRMSREGVTFRIATSTCPLCTPYRGMLQTGRYPTHTGLILNSVDINPNQRCLAHIFRDAGYTTGYIGKWHLVLGARKYCGKHAATEYDRRRIRASVKAYRVANPDSEYVPKGSARLGYDHWQAYNFHENYNDYWYYEDTAERRKCKGYETDVIIDQALEFIRRQKDTRQPFFLMIAPHPPHPPFDPAHCPAGYLERIPDKLKWSANVPREHIYRRDNTEARCYYAMSSNVDHNIGRIMKYLDNHGLSENTILVFTSDHGEMLGSHNGRGKMSPYSESVHIPLIVRWRGHINSGMSDALHSPVDHLPTLCGLAGLEVPGFTDGIDHSRHLLHRASTGRDALLMMNYVSHHYCFDSGTKWPEWRGVRTKQYTYIKWLVGQEELYDDSQDPQQLRNLVGSSKARAR